MCTSSVVTKLRNSGYIVAWYSSMQLAESRQCSKQRVDNAMPCHRAEYNRHDVTFYTEKEKNRKKNEEENQSADETRNTRFLPKSGPH